MLTRDKKLGTWFGSVLSSTIKKYSKIYDYEIIMKLAQKEIALKEGTATIDNRRVKMKP
jgi:hypothetical protein